MYVVRGVSFVVTLIGSRFQRLSLFYRNRRNYLLGEVDDKINVLRHRAGHNIRLILKKLREKLFLLFAGLLSTLRYSVDWQKEGTGLPALANCKKGFFKAD